MSGGHFDYMQYHIDEIADSIENYLNGKEIDADEIEIDNYIEERYLEQDEIDYIRKHHRTMPNPYEYNKDTLKEFKHAVKLLREAAVYAQRIDYLLCGDDGEETFHERLKEDLNELNNEHK